MALSLAYLVFGLATLAQTQPLATSAAALLDQALTALGGRDALSSLQGVAFDSSIYRPHSLMESLTPGFANTATATAGNATISYDLSGDLMDIRRRDDRQYYLSDFWIWAEPTLPPWDISLVTRNNYSCYVRGNEMVMFPNELVGGYQDTAYTRVLNRDAMRLSPKLLLMMEANVESLTAADVEVGGVMHPSFTDEGLNLTVILDGATMLPRIIRAYEDHYIFGPSTNDFVIYNYTSIGGVQFPHRLKYIYNEEHQLFDSILEVRTNPTFPTGFFDGPSLNNTNMTQPGVSTAPTPMEEYGDAEVFESSQSLIWAGAYRGSLSRLNVTRPLPGVPTLWHLAFDDAPSYRQIIAEFTDRVMVVDAPAHQSQLVMQWVAENIGKPITHLLITHHHHDHNYGAIDYVAAGAVLVVPEEYRDYWANIPGVEFETVTEEEPFIYRDETMQVRAIWHSSAPHADDWMYFTFTLPCPNDNDTMGIMIADVWSPGATGRPNNPWEQFPAIRYLTIAREDRIPRDYLVIPSHGVPTNSSELYEETGQSYPNYSNSDFLPGGPWC